MTTPRAPLRAVAVSLVLAGFVLGGLQMTRASRQRPDYRSAAAYIDHYGAPTAPAVDLVAPTPGPPTATEAALAIDQPAGRHVVLRIGLAPLSAVLGVPPYTPLPLEPGEDVARTAAALAGTGVLFIVAPTAHPLQSLETIRRAHGHGGAGATGAFNAFLGAPPARFRPAAMRTFPGFVPVSVYVYRG